MTTDHVAEEVVAGAVKAAEVGKELLGQLVGKTVEQARKLVQDGGFKVREAGKNDMVDMIFDPDRVTLRIENGVVDSADAG